MRLSLLRLLLRLLPRLLLLKSLPRLLPPRLFPLLRSDLCKISVCRLCPLRVQAAFVFCCIGVGNLSTILEKTGKIQYYKNRKNFLMEAKEKVYYGRKKDQGHQEIL